MDGTGTIASCLGNGLSVCAHVQLSSDAQRTARRETCVLLLVASEDGVRSMCLLTNHSPLPAIHFFLLRLRTLLLKTEYQPTVTE